MAFDPLARVIGNTGVNSSAFAPRKRIDLQQFLPQQQVQQQAPIQNRQTQGDVRLQNEIQKIDDQNLKYSMDRTCGTTDCSAFTRDTYKNAYGIDIGNATGSQQNYGKTVTDGKYKNGDLIFTSPDNGKRTGGISHVGIYQDGNVTDFTSAGGGGVRTTPMSQYYKPWKVQRVI